MGLIMMCMVQCDVCYTRHGSTPVEAGPENNWHEYAGALKNAEQDGWKTYRLARDVYYGKAWCPDCKDQA